MSWLTRRSATFLASTWRPRRTPSRFQRCRKRRLQNQNRQPARSVGHPRSNRAYPPALAQKRAPRKGLGHEPRKRRPVPLVPTCLQRPLRRRVARRGPPRLNRLACGSLARGSSGCAARTISRLPSLPGNWGVGVDRLSLGTHVRNPQPATPGPGGFASPPRRDPSENRHVVSGKQQVLTRKNRS